MLASKSAGFRKEGETSAYYATHLLAGVEVASVGHLKKLWP
jgi:hypothetical protein